MEDVNKRLVKIKILVNLDPTNFPESKMNGSIEDQVYDLFKQFLRETFDISNPKEIKIIKLNRE